MTKIVVFAAGVVVGVIGTLLVEKPKEVAEMVRAAAAAAGKKLREYTRPVLKKVKDRSKGSRPT